MAPNKLIQDLIDAKNTNLTLHDFETGRFFSKSMYAYVMSHREKLPVGNFKLDALYLIKTCGKYDVLRLEDVKTGHHTTLGSFNTELEAEAFLFNQTHQYFQQTKKEAQ